MYHSSAFARERDKIRQSVLENLGWTILRVWSTEWWTNKEGALKKVDDTLRRCLEEDRQEQTGPDSVDGPNENSGKGLDNYDNDLPEPIRRTAQEENVEPPQPLPAKGRPVRYSEFEGLAGPDPRETTLDRVAEGLCRIVQAEGPVLAKRAYDVLPARMRHQEDGWRPEAPDEQGASTCHTARAIAQGR